MAAFRQVARALSLSSAQPGGKEAVIAIGSNVGDRAGNFHRALTELRARNGVC
jgi:hypothetical protein